MNEQTFLEWAVDIEWTMRRLRWLWAITIAALALVLTE